MPDKGDILKDPDAELAEALRSSEEGDDMAACSAFRALHRHLLAGGPLPAQWRGEGTAVGRLLVANATAQMLVAGTLEAWEQHDDALAVARHAVTGEG